MDWSYGDLSRILIHGISSSTLCSEQMLSAFHAKRFSLQWIMKRRAAFLQSWIMAEKKSQFFNT